MSKKTEKKKQEKIIADKTFGLKNKNKSKQVQNFCKGVVQQVKHSGVSMSKLESEEYERKKLEKQQEEEERLIQSLYQAVDKVKQQESEDEEVDPKTILCEYYKQGLCQKGKKCMYSHDMSLEQKTAILDLYTDQRQQLQDDWDTCNNWDEKTLKDIVEANEKTYKSQIPSAKVCDYFLDALEKGKYGWRWVCPNGMTCHYKHCLPQGYVFRKKEEAKQKQEGDLEEEIDEAISMLQKGGTKITKEVFEKWKQERAERKKVEAEKQKLEESKKKGVKQTGNQQMTGRALFVYDPTLFVDDDEAENEYERQEQIDEEEEEDDENKQQFYEGNDKEQEQTEDVDQQFQQQQ